MLLSGNPQLPKVSHDLVKLAAEITSSPISVISLVDRDRQWFKAKVGLNEDSTARDISFCTHTILNARGVPLVIPNAQHDSRFSENPLVTGPLGIPSYMGFPLVLYNEYSVGSLCVIDRQAKQLSQEQLGLLEELAEIAVRRLEALAPELRSGLLNRFSNE